MNSCRRCLTHQGMTIYLHPSPIPAELMAQFHILPDGVCNICHAYDAALDRAAIAEELEQLVFECDGLDAPALVALSGGKDSLSTLYAVKRTLGLRAHAALFQNGFIPQDVEDRCADACARLDVPLHVLRPTSRDAEVFRADVAGAAPGRLPPCALCARLMGAELLTLADQLDCRWVVMGTNYFAKWGERVQATILQTSPLGRTITFINLPFALGFTSTDTQKNLDALGVQPRRDLVGVSTNCRVPGIIQNRVAQVIGHVPELEDLAVEVMVGHRTRAEALLELRRKAPQHTGLVDALEKAT